MKHLACANTADNMKTRGLTIVLLRVGSHLKTHAKVKDLIESTVSPTLNRPYPFTSCCFMHHSYFFFLSVRLYQPHSVQVVQKFRNADLDVGPPQRALLRRGDVVLAHQRLAHVAGPNGCDVTRTNIYFRVSNKSFSEYTHAYCISPTPWVSFHGLSHLDECQNEVIEAETPFLSTRELLTLRSREDDTEQMTDEEVQHFVRQGFVVKRNMIKQAMIDKARKKVANATANNKFTVMERKNLVVFNDRVGRGTNLTDILLRSGIVGCVERLLGKQNVMLLDAKADLIVKQCVDDAQEEAGEEGPCVRKGGWEVSIGKGRFWHRGANHLVRVVVVLSDGLDEDRNHGQIAVWPGKFGYPLMELL